MNRTISTVLELCNRFLWGVPVLGMILLVGGWLTVRCGFVQLRLFPDALRDFFRRLGRQGRDSGFRSLCTALAATVGTGNIAGVAGAIALGGPGAVFWMWVSAFLGLVIKFAESTLAVRFREIRDGEAVGGPMYIICRGLPKKWHSLAWIYSGLGIMAAFGVGNAAQVNAVIAAVEEVSRSAGFSCGRGLELAVGSILAVAVFRLVSRGADRIGQTAEILIPVVAGAYIVLCLAAIACHPDRLGPAFSMIFQGAFRPEAVTGGVVGSSLTAMRVGVSRGTFTNEAGMGTAAMAHAGADVPHPVQQGLMGIMEVFLDTMVICTLTALVILTAPVSIPYGTPSGAELTAQALAGTFGPWVSAFLCGCLALFALATILGWGLYAGRCAGFLLGGVSWPVFAVFQSLAVLAGALLEPGAVWTVSELMNGLMAVPNLIALLLLTPELVRLIREYKTITHGA